jgi:thymidylate synthase (FAD)
MAPFLEDFDVGLGFSEYVHDTPVPNPGAHLVKTAGQVCYASWGPRRTHNADAARYIRQLIDFGHESVLEHACYSLFIYGVSRSLTHELVRHRFLSISQLSQRYVSGSVLRFVERPEFQCDPELHALFERRIDRAAADYQTLADILRDRQETDTPDLTAAPATDRRKRVQQAARALLPNEAETFLAATGNARAWRWVLRLRGSVHAEPEIRELAVRIRTLLQQAEPLLFGDLV